MPDKRAAGRAAARFRRDLRRASRASKAAEQASALLAMRRALLPDPLPAAQQHPRLAEADRRGPAARRPTSCPPRPTTSPRSAAASARRTGCAKAIASSSNRATARSPSARSRNTSPTPPGSEGWVKPSKPRARAAPRASASSAPGPAGLAAAEQLRAQGLPGARLRPLRPRRRPADLRHSQLQAGEGDRAAPRASCCARRGITFHLNCEVGRDVTLAELRAAPRRGADRDRRLQGARHRRRRASASAASCRRSTI